MSINSATVTSTPLSTHAVAILGGRALLSAMFILAGYAKLTAIAGTAAWFESIGLPFPTVTTILVGLVELIGGIAVLAGYQTRIASITLAVFTLAATAIAHLDFGDANQVLMLQKNLAVAGGFLVLAASGAGALSVDARRG